MQTDRRDVNYRVFENLKPGEVCLSVGCGTAQLEGDFTGRGGTVYGIDIDERSIAQAKTRIKWAQVIDIESTQSLGLPLGMFDAILFADVLEHLREPVHVLKKLRPYLKENGRMIVSLPNVANWKVRLGLLIGRFDYASSGLLDRTHVRFYTLKSAKALIQDAGLEILGIDYSTNMLNEIYGALRGKRSAPVPVSGSGSSPSPVKRGGVRKKARAFLEWLDYRLAGIFRGLLAFQYIIIAR